MKIAIVVGMPAAGKNIACQYAQAKEYPYFSTGDIVRAEVKKSKTKADAEITAKISTELRGEDGLGVTRIAVDEALKQKTELVFLEGIRSWPEVELIQSRSECIIVAFLAPRKLRLLRVQQRGRDDDSVELFSQRDQREMDYGVAVCIAQADAYVVNAGSVDDALRQLDDIINKL